MLAIFVMVVVAVVIIVVDVVETPIRHRATAVE